MKNRIQNIFILALSLSAAVLFYLTLSGGMGLFGLYRPEGTEDSPAPDGSPLQPDAAVVNDGAACLQRAAPRLLTP